MHRIALLAFLALNSCITPVLSDTTEGEWRLAGLDRLPVDGGLLQVSLTVAADGSVSGKGPCAHWTAANLAELSDLQIDPITVTKVACEVLPDEARFFEALAQMQTGTVGETGVLILASAEGRMMEFHPQSRLKICRTCMEIRLPPAKQP